MTPDFVRYFLRTCENGTVGSLTSTFEVIVTQFLFRCSESFPIFPQLVTPRPDRVDRSTRQTFTQSDQLIFQIFHWRLVRDTSQFLCCMLNRVGRATGIRDCTGWRVTGDVARAAGGVWRSWLTVAHSSPTSTDTESPFRFRPGDNSCRQRVPSGLTTGRITFHDQRDTATTEFWHAGDGPRQHEVDYVAASNVNLAVARTEKKPGEYWSVVGPRSVIDGRAHRFPHLFELSSTGVRTIFIVSIPNPWRLANFKLR